MKKLILILAAATISMHVMAQDKYVTTALTELSQSHLDEAKEAIDKAMANPESSEKPKALWAKAQVYYGLQMSDKYKASNPYREGFKSLMKLIEVKPDYEKEGVDQLLAFSLFYFYNDGAKANNDKHFSDASEFMGNVVKIHDLNGGKRFSKLPADKLKQLDTLSAQAYQTMANASYYSNNYAQAIPLLINVKNNPITRSPTAYECLIDAYNKNKNTADAYTTIGEARKAFPEDVTIRNYELNYYIMAGKQDDLIKKLEEASAKEPGNSDILFNIATTYLSMANPKEGAKPANAAELTAKSEDAFQRTLKIAPDNAGYNYNFGALYYNQATDYNDKMNAITGSSATDLKKYDEIKAKRDAEFVKSMPYFEKAYTVLSANEASLKGEDRNTYKSTLLALKEVYLRQNKMDKSAEMKKKYESIN
jgi:hypothetical protein